MSTSDDDPTAAPFPDHVISGTLHDPVVETAPQAEAAPDDEDAADRFLANEGAAVLPVTGTQTGVILPPASR